MPWAVHLAAVAGGVGALALLFSAVWAHALAGDVPRWLAAALLALALAQFGGVVRLGSRRGWRLLAVASAAVVIGVPVAVVASSTGAREPVADTVGGLAVLLVGPAVAGVLASSPSARAWAQSPQSSPS